MSRRGASVRAAAARAVDAVAADGRSLDVALREQEADLAPEDRSLLRHIAFGTIRHHFRIRAHVDVLLARRPRKRDRIVESLIAVGLFQLTDTRIPEHAAVSATVEAARLLGLKGYAGLVNAILRRFIREGRGKEPPTTDEARFDHPAWMIQRVRADWPGDADAILDAANERAPMWLRVNNRHGSKAEYLGQLAAADVDFALPPGLPDAVLLMDPLATSELPGFAEGAVSVQDAAAQIPAPWLLAEGSGRVLDACAAPGGKTAHLLELGGDEIDLTAIDVDAARLDTVRENLGRLGLDATLISGDVGDTESWWDGRPFDRILLDSPCSASGVIRRHPDIKLLRRDSDIATLARTQGRLLERLWPLLRPGGMLLYVTCSIFSAENEAVVNRFLDATPDAASSSVLPNNNIRVLMRERGPGYQLLPGTRDMDGFFYAALTRTNQGR